MLVCEKCKKETAGYEDGESFLLVNFDTKEILFDCPKCHHRNIMKLQDGKPERLPGIGGSHF